MLQGRADQGPEPAVTKPAITEGWVRDTLELVLPDGVVDHRVPEVMRELAAAPQTWTGLEEAFFRPLTIYGVRGRGRQHGILLDELVKKLEEVLCTDDRPYVSEWLKKISYIEWKRRDKSYWANLFRRANVESRLPMESLDPKKNGARSDRLRDAQWFVVIAKYEETYRLPRGLGLVHGLGMKAPLTNFGQIKTPSDWVKMVRYIERGILAGNFPTFPSEDLADRYDIDTALALRREATKMFEGLSYADNFRCAALDDRKEMSHYRWRKSLGCCGSVDLHVTVHGRNFTIGCNHGH